MAADRDDARHLARRAPRCSGRPVLRLPGRRALGPGPWTAVQPRQAAGRPVRPGGRRAAWCPTGRSTATGGRRATGRACARPSAGPGASRLRAVRPALGGGARRLRLGGRRGGPTAHALDRHRRLRAARQGVHAAARRGTGGSARHLRRAGHRRGRALPEGPRRDHRRAAAGAPERARARPGRGGADQLLGLQLDRLLRPAQHLQLARRPRAAGHGVQGDGQGAPPRRARGRPRRGLQPHRRGQPAGTRRCRSAASTTSATTSTWTG